MMALWIDELAEEAADPTEAGRKMRRCFYTLGKITKRQLTVDCLSFCQSYIRYHVIRAECRNML